MQTNAYFEQLNAHLQWQMKKILELETGLSQMKKELAEISLQRQIHVEKIEYKFDQLKIETLEGTLNIGISPANGKSIEDMTVGGKEIELSDPERYQMFQRIKDQVDQYLSFECIRDLQFFEGKHQVIFGQDYRAVIIQDLRKQVDKRIDYYLDSVPKDQNKATGAEFILFNKLKNDIQAAIEQHVLTKKSREDHK